MLEILSLGKSIRQQRHKAHKICSCYVNICLRCLRFWPVQPNKFMVCIRCKFVERNIWRMFSFIFSCVCGFFCVYLMAYVAIGRTNFRTYIFFVSLRLIVRLWLLLTLIRFASAVTKKAARVQAKRVLQTSSGDVRCEPHPR